jgi:hypothetical protein
MQSQVPERDETLLRGCIHGIGLPYSALPHHLTWRSWYQSAGSVMISTAASGLPAVAQPRSRTGQAMAASCVLGPGARDVLSAGRSVGLRIDNWASSAPNAAQ